MIASWSFWVKRLHPGHGRVQTAFFGRAQLEDVPLGDGDIIAEVIIGTVLIQRDHGVQAIVSPEQLDQHQHVVVVFRTGPVPPTHEGQGVVGFYVYAAEQRGQYGGQRGDGFRKALLCMVRLLKWGVV